MFKNGCLRFEHGCCGKLSREEFGPESWGDHLNARV